VNPEERRLQESRGRLQHWKRWGPYLSERSWGTVREDYSAGGDAWEYFPHDHARSRAYRWGEDGIAGLSDRHQYVCLALALWNGRDPILKERLFGLTGHEGNHGEDVKECYFYLDSTPTHSYMKFLYKYPQGEFPYARLVAENQRRTRLEPEFDLLDTGIFDEDRYFDVFVEYAKASPEDILVRIQVINRGPDSAALHLLPTIWFRNTWSWGLDPRRPRLSRSASVETFGAVALDVEHFYYGRRVLLCEGSPELLFTENETNMERLFGVESASPYVKDGIGEAIVHGRAETVNPDKRGTRAAAHYALGLAPGQSATVRLRLTKDARGATFGPEFEALVTLRQREADAFYGKIIGRRSPDATAVARQAFGGLLWSKQFYNYEVARWLRGDPDQPDPPAVRRSGRNCGWQHLYNADVISMPDAWEYPWYAAWDLAFHCIPLALVDPDYAKEQLVLLLREWYMHPSGALPAYEWDLSHANPPVHAWAAWRVYKIDKKRTGSGDRRFLSRVFHKLLLNFTWWVNREDADGRNIFQGGFLGLDNIGVFDRGAPLPFGGRLEQSDATSWMGMYCLNMLQIALELAREDPAYEDVASKFFEHFVSICAAMNNVGGSGVELWDPEDGFYYDVLRLPNGLAHRLKVRSMVGLIPLFAVETLEPELVDALPGFKRRMHWFLENRADLAQHVETSAGADGGGARRLLCLVGRDRLRRVLGYMLDEAEFLSPFGIRSLSRHHREHPYVLGLDGGRHGIGYEPAESATAMFGGNSNWRGPVWFPTNFLIIEALQRFHNYLGDSFRVEMPMGSGQTMPLWQVAAELSRRLVRLFLRGDDEARPIHGRIEKFRSDPHWRDLVLFHEYFHGDDGQGLGASHQTGWTALVAKLIQQSGA
jgi:hypothetical protein